MVNFVDEQRDEYGIEPICKVLPIAPSTYYKQKARQADPDRLPPRFRRDQVLRDEIKRVFDENFQVYGARKVWLQLLREGQQVARCTIGTPDASDGASGRQARTTLQGNNPCGGRSQTT